MRRSFRLWVLPAKGLWPLTLKSKLFGSLKASTARRCLRCSRPFSPSRRPCRSCWSALVRRSLPQASNPEPHHLLLQFRLL